MTSYRTTTKPRQDAGKIQAADGRSCSVSFSSFSPSIGPQRGHVDEDVWNMAQRQKFAQDLNRDTYAIEGTAWNPNHTSHLNPNLLSISSSMSFFTCMASVASPSMTSFAVSLSPFNKDWRLSSLETLNVGSWMRGRTRKWKIDFGYPSKMTIFLEDLLKRMEGGRASGA